ncbi:MAG: diacylglycerol kinase family protein [Croceibacterium sp.]
MAAPPLPVIVNRSGGTASSLGDELAEQLQDAFAKAGQPIALDLVDGKDIADAVARHAAAPRIAVGGGDGTIASAAQVVAKGSGELAVLPLGTRNHFARQLGVPLDLEGAAALAAKGTARPVDLGDANGRTFINNFSAGAYVDLVHEREQSSLSGVLALAYGSWRALAKLRSRSFALAIDDKRQQIRTPLLFVGNNRYQVADGKPGERDAMDDGMLSAYGVAPLPRTALLAAALRILVAKPRMHRDFVLDELAREVIIEGTGELDIALDGECMRIPLPLTLTVRPKVLAVVQPAPTSD